MLQQALDCDEYKHATTAAYTMDGTYSTVYENEKGPVGVLRCSKTLRLVAVFCDNQSPANATTVIKMVVDACVKAKENGFLDVIFETDSTRLKDFCISRLGFLAAGTTLVRSL
jgi:hypothetical protein